MVDAYGRPVNTGNGVSVASLVLGILSICLYFTLIPGLIAICLGVKGRRQSRAITGRPNGMATAGMVMGIVATAFFGVFLLFFTVGISMIGGSIDLRERQCRNHLREISIAIVKVYDQNGGFPPYSLNEVDIPGRLRLDPWDRQWFYVPFENGFYVGSTGANLDDPSDDIWWDGYAGTLNHGPLPYESEPEDGPVPYARVEHCP
jgi:hypothetical protein